jgi:hypothetical protein
LVAGRFADQGLSLASVLQPEGADPVPAPVAGGHPQVALILTTHLCRRAQLDKVLGALAGEGWGNPVVLRIQED